MQGLPFQQPGQGHQPCHQQQNQHFLHGYPQQQAVVGMPYPQQGTYGAPGYPGQPYQQYQQVGHQQQQPPQQHGQFPQMLQQQQQQQHHQQHFPAPYAERPAQPTPPPADKSVAEAIEKLAPFIVRNGPAFEDRLRQEKGGDPTFAFLYGGGADHAYYRWVVHCCRHGISPEQRQQMLHAVTAVQRAVNASAYVPSGGIGVPSSAAGVPASTVKAAAAAVSAAVASHVGSNGFTAAAPSPGREYGVLSPASSSAGIAASMQQQLPQHALAPEDEAALHNLVSRLNGSKEAITGAREWLTDRRRLPRHGAALAVKLREHVHAAQLAASTLALPQADAFQRALHLMYLVNDTLFSLAAAAEPPPQQLGSADGESGAAAVAAAAATAAEGTPFRRELLRQLPTTLQSLATLAPSPAERTQAERLVALWEERGLFPAGALQPAKDAMADLQRQVAVPSHPPLLPPPPQPPAAGPAGTLGAMPPGAVAQPPGAMAYQPHQTHLGTAPRLHQPSLHQPPHMGVPGSAAAPAPAQPSSGGGRWGPAVVQPGNVGFPPVASVGLAGGIPAATMAAAVAAAAAAAAAATSEGAGGITAASATTAGTGGAAQQQFPVAAGLASVSHQLGLEDMPVGAMVSFIKLALKTGVGRYDPIDISLLPPAPPPHVEPGRLEVRVQEFYKRAGPAEGGDDDDEEKKVGDTSAAAAGGGGDDRGGRGGERRRRSRSRSRDRDRDSRRRRSHSRSRDREIARGGGAAPVSATEQAIAEDNIGHNLLKRLGWSEGAGLGAAGGGIAEPIKGGGQVSKAGLGQPAGGGGGGTAAAAGDEFEAYRKGKSQTYHKFP